MFDDNFVIVDLETTGLNPQNSEIIEIGAIKVKNNKVVDKMDVFVRPSKPLSYFTTKLTGITNEMVDEGLSLKEALNCKAITVQDILEQAKQDEKYGFCEKAYYSDGGSIEYLYSDYTILKYNTLDGNKDLVIGMQGAIINQVNRSNYKTEFMID